MRPVPWFGSLRILVAILFLFGGLVAVAPGGGAQSVWLGASESTYRYGWLFPQGGDFPGGAVDDAVDDVIVAPEDAAEVPLGAAPVHKALDLVRARVDEPDAETLRLTIEVVDLDTQRLNLEHLLSRPSYVTSFELSGKRYQITSYLSTGCPDDTQGVCEPFTAPVPVVRSTMYRIMPNDQIPVGNLPGRADAEANTLEVLIPRWALDGTGGAAAPVAGDAVTQFEVASAGGTICIMTCGRIGDRLPDEDAAAVLHTLQIESNGASVRFSDGRGVVRDEEGRQLMRPLTPRALQVDVPLGGQGQVPVRVENLLDGKALVLTRAEALSDHAVKVQVPQSLEVPSKAHRKLLVTLESEADFPIDDPLVLRLHLESVGPHAAVDVVTVFVRSVPPLSPDAPRLYLHTHTQGQGLIGGTGIDLLTFSAGVLNTLPDDPLDDGRGATVNSFCFCFNNAYRWDSQSGLAEPVALDPEGEVTLHFEVEAPLPGTLMIEPVLYLGETAVATGAHDVALEQGRNTVTVPLYVAEDATTLEPGMGMFSFEFRAMFRPTGVLLAELAGLAEPTNPRLVTEGASWIGLPIVDPSERFRNATHLTVDLDRGTDRVQYLNPGRTTLWNLTIGNHADENDTVRVDATAPAGWKARIEPGTSYRLGPGESVTVGVLATAPRDAAEGANVQVVVTIASALAEGDATGATLSAVVTSGTSIDEPAYIADNETKSRLAKDTTTQESPGFSLVLGSTLALLGVAWRRRTASG